MTPTRVLTGITTTGTPHLGNYVGAIRPAIAASKDPSVEAYLFLADYHALIKNQNPDEVAQSSREIAATWLALGLDPEKTFFYRQSDIPEVTELSWVLTCSAAKGLMNRAHAYKAAVQANETAGEDPDYGRRGEDEHAQPEVVFWGESSQAKHPVKGEEDMDPDFAGPWTEPLSPEAIVAAIATGSAHAPGTLFHIEGGTFAFIEHRDGPLGFFHGQRTDGTIVERGNRWSERFMGAAEEGLSAVMPLQGVRELPKGEIHVSPVFQIEVQRPDLFDER